MLILVALEIELVAYKARIVALTHLLDMLHAKMMVLSKLILNKEAISIDFCERMATPAG